MFKEISKYIGVAVIAFLVLYLGYVVGWEAKHYLDNWKTLRKVDTFNNMILQLFKNDTYGGKTPEETYNLFVDALKKQDVDLAVKYIVLDSDLRPRSREKFNEMKKNDKLREYGEKLPEWNKWEQIKDNYNDWQSQAKIEYGQVVTEPITIYDDVLKEERVLQPGVYGRSIVFVKNINNLWKISSL